MRPRALLFVVILTQTGLVGLFLAAVHLRLIPLGVPGEWVWLRVPHGPGVFDLALGGCGLLIYVGGTLVGWACLTPRAGRAREVAVSLALCGAAAAVQLALQSGAPIGFGLEKWILALYQPGSSGYFTVAKYEATDLEAFLHEYPSWVRRQDALHIGTHPPGLIVSQAVLLQFLKGRPGLAREIIRQSPESVMMVIRVFGQSDPMTLADQATLVTGGLLTMLACSFTVLPLYWLARQTLTARGAFATAALWPVVPAAVLFQPTADTAFPLFTTISLLLAALATQGTGLRLGLAAALAGVCLGVGMQCSLVFLPLGLIIALKVAAARRSEARPKLLVLGTIGAGFLAATLAAWFATGANPFEIWWLNQLNHSRFYREYPRSFPLWAWVNPVELAVALGLPVSCWALIGLVRRDSATAVAWATTLVLALLTLSGRNLSEVARLWIPFMPALVLSAGSGMEARRAGPGTLAVTVALAGIQALALEAMIQVVYPV